jgi:hypothetical protein
MAHFQADVILGEAALGSALAQRGRKARFFRHPYLHTRKPGHDPHELDRFLERFGYHTAPVTVDAQDWLFAEIYAWAAARGDDVRRNAVATAYLEYLAALLAHTEKASVETLGREPAQVLLMHASALNFDHIDAILNLIAARGYDFVSLEQALKDQAYAEKLPSRGSWLNGWREVRKLPKTADPDPGRFLGTVLEDYRLVQRAHPAAAGPPAERICGC